MRGARRLEADSRLVDVPIETVALEVLSGGIFVVRDCLRSDHVETVRRISLDVIERVAGSLDAEAVRSRGFAQIHEIIAPAALMKVADTIQRETERVLPQVVRDIALNVLQHARPFHYEQHPNVRFHVPFDSWKPHKSEYDKYARDHGEGKLSPHDPHRDGWYRCPENAINVWLAVGRVQRGNGMSLYPDVYARAVQRTGAGRLAHGQPLGRRVNFELEPGDALVFHGKHLHASELNRTNETRYVVSFRMTLTRPRVSVLSNHKYVWSGYDKGMVGRGIALTEKVLRNIEGLLRKPPAEPQTCLEPIIDAVVARVDAHTSSIPSSAVRADVVLPLSGGLAATRVDGRAVVFRRTCPHAAADLAMGSVSGGELFCPEHNLPFDLRTGESPCKSLSGLKYVPSSERDGSVLFELAPRVRRTSS